MRIPFILTGSSESLRVKTLFAAALVAAPLWLAEGIAAEAQDAYPTRPVRIDRSISRGRDRPTFFLALWRTGSASAGASP